MLDLSDVEKQVLVAAQRGIAVVERPFAVLGEQYGLAEDAVVDLLNRLLKSGEARRFGAVFDSRRLGYRSALCCMDVPPERLECVAAKIVPLNGVTHLYQRGWTDELPRDGIGGPGAAQWPNLWFTLAAPSDSFEGELDALRNQCAPFKIRELPALRRFKIDVVFDMRAEGQTDRGETGRRCDVDSSDAFVLTPDERRIVRYCEGDLPVVPDFYQAVADALAMPQRDLTAALERWLETGVVRRIGVLLRHRLAGFMANGMCCWNVSQSEVTEAGKRLAACREVTHCYERPALEEFPFNLFAMIHTTSWERTQSLFKRIADDCGLRDGQLLLSVREFKKTSMRFFA